MRHCGCTGKRTLRQRHLRAAHAATIARDPDARQAGGAVLVPIGAEEAGRGVAASGTTQSTGEFDLRQKTIAYADHVDGEVALLAGGDAGSSQAGDAAGGVGMAGA